MYEWNNAQFDLTGFRNLNIVAGNSFLFPINPWVTCVGQIQNVSKIPREVWYLAGSVCENLPIEKRRRYGHVFSRISWQIKRCLSSGVTSRTPLGEKCSPLSPKFWRVSERFGNDVQLNFVFLKPEINGRHRSATIISVESLFECVFPSIFLIIKITEKG